MDIPYNLNSWYKLPRFIPVNDRVQTSIADHLRDFVLDLEKYKVVQTFHV